MAFIGLEIQSYRIQAWDFSSIPDIQDCKFYEYSISTN